MTTALNGVPAAVADAIEIAAGTTGVFGSANSAELDEREVFPAEECSLLDACGLARVYVPPDLGGSPGGLPDLVEALRGVARRDLTVAVAHGKTFLGAASVWVAGSPAQREYLARLVLDGAVVSWGLTEPGRGSDLLAGQLTATRTPDGWRLDGTKWPINNATRGRFICVLARTDPLGGVRGFSLFLVDKRALASGTWQCLPKEPTHGIRGADISGIRFTGAEVPEPALVGRPGDGVNTVLLALQLTRTACSALSLGAGEHSLRLAYEFAAGREMHGTTLLRLPLARRTLGAAAAALALAEDAAFVAARAAHCLPGEMSVVSAVVKATVPSLVQQVIDELAELIGARGFLLGHHADGMFQKLDRDHRIVGIFDGSTAVNRSALIGLFPLLATAYRAGRYDSAGLATTADPAAPLPGGDFGGLRLLTRVGCSVVQGLPAAVTRLDRLPDGTTRRRIRPLAADLLAETEAVVDAMGALGAVRPTGYDLPAAGFAVARRYELCFAGAAALHRWLAEPDEDGATRLAAALCRALEQLRPGVETPDPDEYERFLTAVEAGGGPR